MMSVEHPGRKPDEPGKINSNNYGELLWWSYILSTTPEKILTTIDKVGNVTEHVRKYLNG